MEGGHSLLESRLRDETAEPVDMPISFLRSITNNFSEDQQIGSGGFAVVYKGLLENGEVVAVKKLSNSIGMDENKYNQEVRCLMKVKHRNIIRFLGYCANTQGKMIDYEGKFVMADVRERLLCFEYVPNGTLKDYITDASSGLEWRKRYKIIKGICEGLRHLHEMRIAHLDLKPGNILLDDNMVPKIADFGISRCFDQGQSYITATKLVGTPGYLAPECDNLKITPKLDMFSLGVIILEILTGQKGYCSVENVLESWRNRLKTSSPIDTVLGQIRVCFEISMNCRDFDPKKRPTTQHIIELLKQTECMDEDNETDAQMPAFNDDETPPTFRASGGSKNLVTMSVKYLKEYAALTADTVTAEMEIKATSVTALFRKGLDLVVVLDVSGGMEGKKMDNIKKATEFVITKLTSRDRLSIVTFSDAATRLSPLRSMTEAAKEELKALVDGLQAGGGTNIKAGLKTGLAVIADRVNTKARIANIFLMSHAPQTCGDVRHVVNPGNKVAAIYTFAFGRDADHELMADIAAKSPSGTFSSVPDGGDQVTLVFSQLLGGLLTLVAQDVKLVITPNMEEGDVATIGVAPDTDYNQATDAATGAITVNFGTLYVGDRRRVVVTVSLKDVSAAASGAYEAALGDTQLIFAAPGKWLVRETPQDIQIMRTPTPSQATGNHRPEPGVWFFSSVPDGAQLMVPFSQLLAGLLTAVAQDVKLVITPNTEEDVETIIRVPPGAPGTDYTQTTDAATGAITVNLGTLFAGEGLRVLLTISLKDVSAAASEAYEAALGDIQLIFSARGKWLVRQTPQEIQIMRTPTPSQPSMDAFYVPRSSKPSQEFRE